HRASERRDQQQRRGSEGHVRLQRRPPRALPEGGQVMSKIIHSLPQSQAAAVSFNLSDMIAPHRKREQEAELHPDTEEVCIWLRDRIVSELKRLKASVAPGHSDVFKLPQFNIDDGGFSRLAGTRKDFHRLLAPWKRALSDFIAQVPRDEDESISDYCERL